MKIVSNKATAGLFCISEQHMMVFRYWIDQPFEWISQINDSLKKKKRPLNVKMPIKGKNQFKGIVHFEVKMWYLSAYPKGIQDVGVFFLQ